MDKILELIKLLENTETVEIKEFRMDFDELELHIAPVIQETIESVPIEPVEEKTEIEEFTPPTKSYPGKVTQVKLGGGTRKTIYLGGQKALYRFEEPQPNPPTIAFDVFDIPLPLPRPIREHFGDVMEDPVEWAKKAINKYNADMITLHLIGTGSRVMDKSPREAAKNVEDVLQAVDVPLVISGSGDPEKDPIVLEKAAEVAEDERCLLSAANLELDYKKIANAAINYNHAVLAWAFTDLNMQKTLNKYLMNEGLKQEDIVMDPTTCALGYGIEFSIDVMTRIRLAALRGDTDLQMPMSAGVTNAWSSREAWMKKEEWGPTNYRGPLWEIFTGISLMLSGVDLLMMLHPTSVKLLKEVSETFTQEYKSIESKDISNWITQL